MNSSAARTTTRRCSPSSICAAGKKRKEPLEPNPDTRIDIAFVLMNIVPMAEDPTETRLRAVEQAIIHIETTLENMATKNRYREIQTLIATHDTSMEKSLLR